jgi:hypothetical protein
MTVKIASETIIKKIPLTTAEVVECPTDAAPPLT